MVIVDSNTCIHNQVHGGTSEYRTPQSLNMNHPSNHLTTLTVSAKSDTQDSEFLVDLLTGFEGGDNTGRVGKNEREVGGNEAR